jgi:hypothetical protein
MAVEKIKNIENKIKLALKRQGTYTKDLDLCIHSTAVSYYAVLLAQNDIENAEFSYVKEITREGNEKMEPHPAFKVLEKSQSSLLRGLRELKLTTSTLEKVMNDELDEIDREHDEIKNSDLN